MMVNIKDIQVGDEIVCKLKVMTAPGYTSNDSVGVDLGWVKREHIIEHIKKPWVPVIGERVIVFSHCGSKGIVRAINGKYYWIQFDDGGGMITAGLDCLRPVL